MEAMTTTLMCRPRPTLGPPRVRHQSPASTANPRPPRTMSPEKTARATGSSLNITSESDCRAKPALQNADTEWNTPFHAAARGEAPCALHAKARTTAPAASMLNVARTMKIARREAVAGELRSRTLPSAALPRIPRSRPRITAAKVDRTMMLRPPIWMSARITTWPKVEKSRGVSSTIKPVTQDALVAVKRASTGLIW